MIHSPFPARALRAFLLSLFLVACADNGTTGPDDVAPVITITGVTDGATLSPPVTITIGVAPGTYTATLNGASFVSGGTVGLPGSYTLVVNARNGLATREQRVDFTLVGGGTGDVLIVRVLDLQLGSSGAPGDALVLTDSSGLGVAHALIDAGARSDNQNYVRSRLAALGIDTLRFMQLTHAHFDHYAGMDEILVSGAHVRSFVYNGQVRNAVTYDAVLAAAAAHADTVTPLAALRVLELGTGPVPTVVTMIPPLTTWLGHTNNGAELNNGSIGTLVEHGAFRMFFTGDGEVDANNRWRITFPALTGDVDVLKAGHHGANNAVFDDGFGSSNTASAWLTHTSPTIAVISANGTSHPRVRALAKLRGETTAVYCTNVHGEIRITVDEAGFYTVQVERNADSDCVAGSEATT